MDILFSKATAADCDSLSKLVNSAYRGDSSRRGWTTEADYIDGQRTDPQSLEQEIEKAGHRMFKAVHASTNELVGCVLLSDFGDRNIKRTYLGMLTVKPDLQAAGLGRKLVGFAENEARESGSKFMTMGVVQIRDTLIAWYERLGYKKTGETKSFPYGQAEFGIPLRDDLHFIILEKRL
jgi:ribosomal protein S18 acetylase RimI-like enzyme